MCLVYYYLPFLQQEAATAIEECKASITSLEHCKTLLQVVVTQLQDCATKLIEEFKIQQAIERKTNNAKAPEHNGKELWLCFYR